MKSIFLCVTRQMTKLSGLRAHGLELVAAFHYGTSRWTETAKLICRAPSFEVSEGGNFKHSNCFLKVRSSSGLRPRTDRTIADYSQVTSRGDYGRSIMMGEFSSLLEMHATSPNFVPKPLAWGTCRWSNPEACFLLTEYRDVHNELPNPDRLTARLAELHRYSQSPTGKFGFHEIPYPKAAAVYPNCWQTSWSKLFQQQLALTMSLLGLDRKASREWKDFKTVCNLILTWVVPRLLEPLQSGGRSIKPCLIHGNLGHGSTAVDMATGEPFVFAPVSMYGKMI